jgi:hypothetical protein
LEADTDRRERGWALEREKVKNGEIGSVENRKGSVENRKTLKSGVWGRMFTRGRAVARLMGVAVEWVLALAR